MESLAKTRLVMMTAAHFGRIFVGDSTHDILSFDPKTVGRCNRLAEIDNRSMLRFAGDHAVGFRGLFPSTFLSFHWVQRLRVIVMGLMYQRQRLFLGKL